MTTPFTITRRVEFRDTDAAGIMHFSVYFNYMEAAEHALLRKLGTSVVTSDDEGPLGWPRVAVACEYRGALRFEDVVEVQVRLERLGDKSVTYLFEFVKDGKEVARGKMTTVCCRMAEGSLPRSIAIPAEIAALLRPLVSPSPA
jgi:4-hydroxybenzoyl-CoA thioesterase/acyl-CoA thioester hydrolase